VWEWGGGETVCLCVGWGEVEMGVRGVGGRDTKKSVYIKTGYLETVYEYIKYFKNIDISIYQYITREFVTEYIKADI